MRRIARGLVLALVLLAAGASAGSAAVHPYTLAGTKACLLGLPGSVFGLPPATAPTPPLLFVYRFAHAQALLGAWYGNEEIDVEFFRTPLRADKALKKGLQPPYYVGTRVGNTILWRGDLTKKLTPQFRRTVVRCLVGSRPNASPSPVPQATLATFAGSWGGHDRGLTISSAGNGYESTLDSCCDRVYVMRYEILSVRGTLTSADATYRVTSFTRFHTYAPRIPVGSIGTLRLRNGILTNTLSRVYFCSNPAWDVTGACGA